MKITGKEIKESHGPANYPANHQAAMRVPKGGSSCAKCRFVSDDLKRCSNRYFQEWNKSDVLPYDAHSYCSDWFQAKQGEV